MASSGYQAWSVVAGETPTTTKWNLLGSNDASFNTGLGFNDGVIVTRHLASGISPFSVAYNPIKFSVGRVAAFSGSASSLVPVVFDTITYDTSLSFNTSNGRFTCTVAGFYHFDACCSVQTTTGSIVFNGILKNGGEFRRGERNNNWTSGGYMTISIDMQLAVNDYVQYGQYSSNTWTVEAGAGQNWFNGRLMSAT